MIEIIRQTRRLCSRVAARTFIFPRRKFIGAEAPTYVEDDEDGGRRGVMMSIKHLRLGQRVSY